MTQKCKHPNLRWISDEVGDVPYCPDCGSLGTCRKMLLRVLEERRNKVSEEEVIRAKLGNLILRLEDVLKGFREVQKRMEK